MIASEKAVVLGLERNAYKKRTGEDVEELYLYYYLLLDYHDARSEKGFTLLRINIFPDFSFQDFPDTFPILCNFQSKMVRALRGGSAEPRLIKIDVEKPIPVDDSKGFIVFGAKNYSYTSEDSKKPYEGVKLFALGSFLKEPERLGTLPVEVNLQNGKLVSFQRLPGIYDLNLQSVRGRGGTSLYKLQSLRFIEPWGEIPKPSQTQPQAG